MSKFHISTQILQRSALYSGKIYTAGKVFTWPPVTTNFHSAKVFCADSSCSSPELPQLLLVFGALFIFSFEFIIRNQNINPYPVPTYKKIDFNWWSVWAPLVANLPTRPKEWLLIQLAHHLNQSLRVPGYIFWYRKNHGPRFYRFHQKFGKMGGYETINRRYSSFILRLNILVISADLFYTKISIAM